MLILQYGVDMLSQHLLIFGGYSVCSILAREFPQGARAQCLMDQVMPFC